MVLEGSICLGVESFTSAWTKQALWSAITSRSCLIMKQLLVGLVEKVSGIMTAALCLYRGKGEAPTPPPHSQFRAIFHVLVISVVSREPLSVLTCS